MLQTYQRLFSWAEGLVDSGSNRAGSPQLIWFDHGFAHLAGPVWMLALPVPNDWTYALSLTALQQVLAAHPARLQLIPGAEDQMILTYDHQQLICSNRPGESGPVRPTGDFQPVGSWGLAVLEALAQQARFCGPPSRPGPQEGVYIKQQGGWLDTWTTDGRLLRLHSGIRLGWSRPLCGVLPTGPITTLCRQAWGPVDLASAGSWLRLSLESGAQLYLRLTRSREPLNALGMLGSLSGWARFERAALLEVILAGIGLAGLGAASGDFKVAGGRVSVALVDPEGRTTWQAGLPILERHGLDFSTRLDLRLVAKALESLEAVYIVWQYATPADGSSFIQDDMLDRGRVQVVVAPLDTGSGRDGGPGRTPGQAAAAEPMAAPGDAASAQHPQQESGEGDRHANIEQV